ncbi:MAG: hypothetical protein CSA23_04290 [Deltaproteobacteria bacterium]|nr:MAG: hypothetical protein CSA23_04290 [Deltaproteobacteria bacterium]
MAIDASIVPVVMFHSVGLNQTKWIYNHLSEPLEQFEQKLSILKAAGYRFIFWEDLYRHMAGTKILRHPSVMLTFDDGYLDNWVYAFPLLKKYGIKATIFVNPEFVDPIGEPRPQHADEKPVLPEDAMGFLSWGEMRLMEASGLVDIQSHAMTHTWYFSGSEIVDFYKPGMRYPWLGWNLRPEMKYRYMNFTSSEWVPRGYPVFVHSKSLEAPRFFPDEMLVDRIVEFSSGQDESFWKRDDWRDVLKSESHKILAQFSSTGKYESDDDYRNRITWELSESRRLISEHIDKQVDYICWPGGGYNDLVIGMAERVGYKSWTLSSKDQSGYRNIPGSNPSKIKRMGSYTHRYAKGKYLGPGSAEYFFQRLCSHQNDKLSEIKLKLKQVCLWIGKN